MSRAPAVRLVLVLVCCGFAAKVNAEDDGCYTPGSVAGIVIATVVVTLVTAGLAAAFIWYLWKQRKGVYDDDKSEKPIACPPMSPDKQLIVSETNDYAFDNPYFKDDETDTATQDAAEKGESRFHVDNGDATHAQNAKASNGTSGQKKNRPFSSLPFHAVFHPSGKKQKATMDDTYISKHLERITVPLRGHDFTGLGFNICGNMRDGIFVKDVLHRGPASESGKIKAGDRIVGVTVSFGAMVYEDALTILSYASPYDVKLEIEKSSSLSSVARAVHLPSSSPKRLGASTSFRSGGQRRLFHPLYRSQSIDDLTQIGKDSFLGGNSSGSQRDSSSSATPKRSQSVEASNGGMKNRSTYALKNADEVASKSLSSNKGSRKSSTSSCESTGKTATITPPPEKMQAPYKEEPVSIQKETKSSRFRVEQIHVKSEAPSSQPKHQPPAKPAREVIDDKQVKQTDAADEDKILDTSKEAPSGETVVTISTEEVITIPEVDSEGEKPTAPPRKTSTPVKRRAPAPPPVPPTKNETSVVVHRVDDQQQQLPETEKIGLEPSQQESSTSELSPAPDLPDFIPSSKVSDQKVGSSSNSSHVNGRNSPQKEEPSSPGKRKASSLGDLTKLDQGANKKASISSAILERAVSLDLQQTMPGENLIKQKKILRAPTFEDDYDEDHESDLNDTDGNGLKRWDDGLDKVFVGLTNGNTKPIGAIEQDSDMKNGFETESSVHKAISDLTELSVPTTNKVKKLLTVDIDFDSSSSENMSQGAPDSEAQLTSTPAQKTTEVKNFLKDDDSLDDVPYLASSAPQNDDEQSNKHSAHTSSTSIPVFSPVTISIPVIKPDLTHYEKLPSPPPASTHPGLDQNLRMSKTTTASAAEDTSKSTLERISVQSLYRPIFTNKEISTPDLDTNPEKLLNGIDSDSSEHYTTQENTTVESTPSTESNSTSTVTLSPVVANNIAVKAPNNVAGFAKTLIIPGPNDVESLLSLAAEPNTPPPNLVQPPKSVENQ